MRILMINVVCGIKSTGRICTDIAVELEKRGHEVKIAYGREGVPIQNQKFAIKINSNIGTKIHGAKARIFDSAGFESDNSTKRFIEWIKIYDPDVIHLHNIHGYYLNVEILFNFLKTFKKKVIWTFHDCWAFTGHCSYFDYIDCTKWEKKCYNCPQKHEYPKSILFDSSEKNYLKKSKIFVDVPNMTIVTPSIWMAKLVEKSFFSSKKIVVINNGVDLNSFKKTESDIKTRLNIQDKKVILGVAAIWNRRKGLEDFIKLSQILEDDYKIVLVGLTKCQIKQLPSNIIGIERTNSIKELAELYSAAYVFFNPTYEDNFPTTNIEAIACDVPVISYDTGGSKESAELYGYVVKKGNIEGVKELLSKVDKIDTVKNKSELSINNMVQKYIKLYEE